MRIMFLSQSPRDPLASGNHDRVEKQLRSYTLAGTQLDLCYPDDFPGAQVFRTIGGQNLLNGLQHAIEAPALIRKIVWAEEQGYDAVVQSNTFDPGVEAARLAVRIPVIGLFRASLHMASILAGRIGVVVPLDGHIPHTRRIIDSYGMSSFVTDVRSIGIYGNELESKREEVRDITCALMKSMVRDTGAQILLPLGGALIPYVVSPADLEAEVGVPVVNTKSVGIRMAEMCVSLGITHSNAAYPLSRVSLHDLDSYAN